MAKKRYISDNIWSDNWFETLSPQAKLLFMYLLTNSLVSLCGIYEISLKRISYDTGINKPEILKIFENFEKDKKVIFREGVVLIINFIKNQNIKSEKDNLFKGMQREYEEKGCKLLEKIGAIKDIKGASKALGILNLTLPYLTLLNSTENSETPEEKNNNKTNNKENNIKNNYGEFENVKLTSEEYKNLEIRYYETDFKKLITKLDLYIGQVGDKYKSHYMTIINWGKKEGVKEFSKEEKEKIIQKEKRLEDLKKTGEEYDFLKSRKITEEKKKNNMNKYQEMKKQYFNN